MCCEGKGASVDVEPEYRWPGVTYRTLRLLEEVPAPYPFRSHIYRSTFDVEGFAFCDRVEMYCIAEPGKRALLIDTGHPDLCGVEALDGVSKRLGVPWERTEVFLSHFHDDHDGNLLYCAHKGAAKLYSGPTSDGDAALMNKFLVQSASTDLAGDSTFLYIRLVASGKKAQTETREARTEFHGGEELFIAGYNFKVLFTPGHTSNHLCLLDRSKKILFAGDHICLVPPGLMQYGKDEHLVKLYLDSLAQLKAMDLEAVYMCHHNPLLGSREIDRFISMVEGRYESLVRRARQLFVDVEEVTVREAARIGATHYANGLEGFPRSTQIRRISTIFGTLEYLYDLGMLSRHTNDDGALVYRRLW